MEPRRLGGVFLRLPAIVVFTGLILGGCASHPDYDAGDAAKAPAKAKGGAEPLHYSTEQNNDWGDAMTAPLEDLNLKRTAIPQILLDATQRPYDLNGLSNCDTIADEVRKLDAVLGADLDEPPPPPDSSTMGEKGGRMANRAAVGAVRNATRSIIPFRGLMRQMTGAERHTREVDAAIQAGKVRRAYLKGVGMNKNCAPPAAPQWFKPKAYITVDPDYAPQDGVPPKKKKTSRKHQ